MIRRGLGHFLRCKDFSRLVSQAQDRSLSWWERWPLRFHLAVCDGCMRFDAHLRFLRKAMHKYKV